MTGFETITVTIPAPRLQLPELAARAAAGLA
jgi:hypothetical protein